MQDFANYRKSTDSLASRDSWLPDIPSLAIGILLGAAACLVGLKVVQANRDQAVIVEAPIMGEDVVEKSLEFDFYKALKSYVVLPRTYN